MRLSPRPLLAALPLLPTAALAQSRELTYPAVTVTAHLDSSGALTLTERQTIRFTGVFEPGALQPYTGYIVNIPLRYRRAGLPPASASARAPGRRTSSSPSSSRSSGDLDAWIRNRAS